MKIHQFIALDTETTGVDFCASQVIQCGIILVDTNFNSVFEKEWNINYKPEKFAWSESAERIHKIDKETAMNHGLEPVEFLRDLEKDLIRHMGLPFPELHILAANSYFDFVMMQRLWNTHRDDEFIFSHRTVDLSALSLSLFNLSGFKTTLDYLNVDTDEEKRHGALYDAQLHLAAFKKIMDKVRVNE